MMVNTVAPVWDGNETWLVLGGAGLLAAFPLAYSVLLSALYIPIVLMLIGTDPARRGVRVPLQGRSRHTGAFWDVAFAGGSYLAAFCQGAALGAFINGFAVTGPSYDGGALDWLTPFSVFTGAGRDRCLRPAGQHLADDEDRGRAARPHDRLCPPHRAGAAGRDRHRQPVDPAGPCGHRRRAGSRMPNIFYFAPVPILVVATSWQLLRLLTGGAHGKVPRAGPFLLALFLLFLGYTGLAISLWPNIIPPGISFRDAAAPPQSQGFALVGAVVIIPIILAYTGWAYYVFRGKVTGSEGYH